MERSPTRQGRPGAVHAHSPLSVAARMAHSSVPSWHKGLPALSMLLDRLLSLLSHLSLELVVVLLGSLIEGYARFGCQRAT
jgi:hypothetical protein